MPEEEKSIPQVISELWEMLVKYAKQETIDPLKGLGRFVAFGMASAIVGSAGIILLTLGGLRVLQTHTDDHLSGNLDWVPYLAALVLLAVLIAIFVSRINKKGSRA